MTPTFIPGLELAHAFYTESVRPELQRAFPNLAYSAALIGPGSEVLGFDNAMSTDHHWGPRCMLFLTPKDQKRVAPSLHDHLAHTLPRSFRGYSTHFTPPSREDGDHGTQLLLEAPHDEPINHRVVCMTLGNLLRDYLGLQPTQASPSTLDWLTTPSHRLATVVGGAVFHDDLGLQALRARFAWYPHDIWLYLMAATWSRIGQEEHLAPRCGLVGDTLGASIIAHRLIRDVMHLAFLMERRYPPYAKWLGTAFQQLEAAPTLTPVLERVRSAELWQARQEALCEAFELLLERHNALGITPRLDPTCTPFHQRPFRVSHGWRVAHALCEAITEPDVQRIVEHVGRIGGIEQLSDNTDLKANARLRKRLQSLFTEAPV